MEPNKPINIAFPDGFNQPNFTLILGEAPVPVPLIVPHRFSAVVVMSSIAAFFAEGKYPKDPTQNKGVVLYNLQPDKFAIDVTDDVNNPMASIIKSKLEYNPEFLEWGINKDRKFAASELIKFVRRQAANFADPSETTSIIKSLQNFEAKFTSIKSKEDDRKGNKNEQFKTTLEFSKGMISSFTWNLNIPIFKGTPAVKLSVDLEIDEQNGDPAYSFYSLDAELLIRQAGPAIVNEQIDILKDYFVCLEQQ